MVDERSDSQPLLWQMNGRLYFIKKVVKNLIKEREEYEAEDIPQVCLPFYCLWPFLDSLRTVQMHRQWEEKIRQTALQLIQPVHFMSPSSGQRDNCIGCLAPTSPMRRRDSGMMRKQMSWKQRCMPELMYINHTWQVKRGTVSQSWSQRRLLRVPQAAPPAGTYVLRQEGETETSTLGLEH